MEHVSTPENLSFMKWHGAGNDFVMIDSRGREAVVTRDLAAKLGDRNRGVGFDQLAEIRSSDVADIDLDFWNSDGSRAGACGNATRCVARYMMDQTGKTALTIRTARGVLEAREDGDQVAVNMGQPQTSWAEVPLARDVDTAHLPIEGDPAAIGMGNPHCVFFVDDADLVDVAGVGPEFETHDLFPEHTNVEFASVRAKDEIRMRVWERGTGITLACGSGACATAVAAYQRGLTGPKVRMELDGGWLTLDIRDDGVWMTGPTAFVFAGELTPAFLKDL
ncbi:diaminopimelate epimerase [Aliiroseovarius crassostreae]|uniref:Diaminopimelate epimerase n=1 Tax=Aliiroseovarius crassostreae TaxID=154981 RepID=A0A0P7IKU1_9RHOB|nr:diaminopimelate epimerase [Aliiroseovarius crassostreae]KPN64777.1 diaminopimelate epimerase [Aliiroseovarius crassostreae]SFU78403.1 diaminopimelate epimerase [Aliiroseovarius crassostreae]